MKCNYCDKMSHTQNFCYKWKRDNKGGKGKHVNYQDKKDDDKDDRAATVTTSDLVNVYDKDVVNLASCETSSVVDFGVLKMGSDGLTQVVGVRDIFLVADSGAKLILKDVRHVPDIRLNLICTSKLEEEGYCSTFYGGQWKLTKRRLVFARKMKHSSLYWM